MSKYDVYQMRGFCRETGTKAWEIMVEDVLEYNDTTHEYQPTGEINISIFHGCNHITMDLSSACKFQACLDSVIKGLLNG